MKIHLDFKGMPILYKTLNRKKQIDLDFGPSLCTLRELADLLVRRFGTTVKKALLDKNGDVDLEIRVVLNQNTYLSENRMETVLHDGDTLAFLGAA
jgi:hypothetical protein